MGTIDNKIKALVIPSGSVKDDLERAKAAIQYSKENNLNVPYIISGLGPDTNIALGYDENKTNKKLDFHKELYHYMMKNKKGIIGIDIKSVNSVKNILYSFPKGTNGKYAIFSYPLHLKRFEKIISKAKEKDKISKDLEIIYIPTKQNLKQIIYEKLFAKKRKKDLEKI